MSLVPMDKNGNCGIRRESKAGMAQIPVEFNNEVFLLEGTVLRKLHTMRVARVIETLKPRSVLDVGCGNGERLLILATMFPEVDFIGLDLTKEGIEAAQDIVAAGKLPENFDLVSPVCIGGQSFAGTNVDFFLRFCARYAIRRWLSRHGLHIPCIGADEFDH